MAKVAYGIINFKMGAAGANGAMGAALTDVTYIVEDSVNISFPEPEITDITAEEMDSALISLSTKQPKTVVLETMNVDVADLPKFFGGATASTVFTPGVNFDLAEQSFQFTTRPAQGVSQIWAFPRAKCTVSIEANPSKKDVIKLKLTFKVLQPIDAQGAALPDFKVTQA